MLYNFKLDDLIPFFTIGALVIVAIYNTTFYYFNRTKLLRNYSIYLWISLLYLLQSVGTLNGKIDRTPLLPYILCTSTLWLSYLSYLSFIISTLRGPKTERHFLIRWSKKKFYVLPMCVIVNSMVYIGPAHLKLTFSLIALFFNALIFTSFIIIYYLLSKEKRELSNTYILIGAVCILVFNALTQFSILNNGLLFGFTGVAFISLAYFSEIIFFSIAITYRISTDLKEKYEAEVIVSHQQYELEREKKKASDILLKHDFELQNERTKAIIEQRTLIGRKLHDDLSGSLVALKYLVLDFKKKVKDTNEQEKFNEIAIEINNIYTEARNYSHELSINVTTAESKLSYDIIAYLEKIQEQFDSVGLLTINTVVNKEEINTKLNSTQTEIVFFLLKECITNTIKHTYAQHIWINITFDENKCNIFFKNDGQKFSILESEGAGIKGMRSRINELNGIFNINSDEDGTILTFSFSID